MQGNIQLAGDIPTPDSSSSPSVGDVVKAPPGGTNLGSMFPSAGENKVISDEAAGIQKQKMEADAKINEIGTARTQKRIAEADRFLKAEGYAADNIPKPWNADKERAERTTGPMEKFGSAAMVFAGIASAFSKQPAITALSAGAAVLTAINNNDAQAYHDAHQAWKENTDIAIKRFNMQHQMFEDNNQLFDKDISLWKIKTAENAARFNDQQYLNLLQHGQYDKLFELEGMRAKGMDAMLEAKKHWEAWELRRQAFEASVPGIDAALDPKNPRTLQLNLEARALKRDMLTMDSHSTDYIIKSKELDSLMKGHRATPEELAKFKVEAEQRLYSGSRSVTGSGIATGNRVDAAERERRTKEYETDPKSPTYGNHGASFDRAQKEIKAGAATITGNQAEKLTAHIQQFEHSIQTIDDVLDVLENYPAAAGLGGKVMRLEERIGNIMAGSDETDRVQMMRDVELLRAMAPQLLLDRTGRPLSAEAAHTNDIVAGLSTGDTGANTIRAMKELRKRYQQMHDEARGRMGTQAPPAQTAPAQEAPAGNWWHQDKPN